MRDGLHIPDRGWNPTRCFRLPGVYHNPDAYGGGRGIPVQARDLLRYAFDRLTAPPREDDLIKWALADCIVDGRWSMAINAVMRGNATPVFVVPTPGMVLRNWCGDELTIEERPLWRHPPGSHLEDEPNCWSSQARMLGLTRAGIAMRPRT